MFNPYFSIAKRLMRLRKKPMVVNRLGVFWLLYPNDWIDNRILIGRPFEREQIVFAEECIKSNNINVFFDCGANIGLYSILLGEKINHLQIHSFEPVPKTWGRLVSNITLNNLSDRVNAHNFGLGDKINCLDISIDSSSSGCATFDTDAKNHPKRNFDQVSKVNISVFDDHFKETGCNAFFKIDIEGYEVAALVGMEKYLTNNNCILQIELWEQHYDEVVKWLDLLGYSIFKNIGHDIYFKKKN